MNGFIKTAAVAAVAAGTAVIIATSAMASPVLAPRMSGVTLANGVVFNQGKAAHYLARLGRPTTPITRKLLAVERSVDRALAANPAQAGRLARELQSDHPVKVAAAMASLGKLTLAAFSREYGAAVTKQVLAWTRAALRGSPRTGGHNITPDNTGTSGGSCGCPLECWSPWLPPSVRARPMVAFLMVWPHDGQPGSLLAQELAGLVAVSLRDR